MAEILTTRIVQLDNDDLKKGHDWEGPFPMDVHSVNRVQKALKKFGLDIVVGLSKGSAMTKTAFIKIIPQPTSEDVESSMMESISFDDATDQMSITFKNGSRYQYDDVEKAIFQALKEAKSKGRFFQRHVRPWYTYRRVD